MFKEIYQEINKYKTIVLARHIGVDPDALASQTALRDAIKLTFPDKKVYAVGNGSQKFTYISNLDKLDNINYNDTLLIILDTPDKKRVDIENIDMYQNRIKIDHHPFVEKFCDIEYIDDEASSACQLVLELLYETDLKYDEKIIENLYIGMVSDTNRFMFSNTTSKTFEVASKILNEYNLDLNKVYATMYNRPLSEVRLEGYISLNMTVTDNHFGYIKITDEIINKFKVDTASPGNMINNFNFIDEVYVWATFTEDVKNNIYKVSIRSRGPIVNTVAEKYNGGGHKLASGARVKTLEEIDNLIKDLDNLCKEYIDGGYRNENK